MQRELRFRNLISYGVGDFFGGGSFFIIGTLFLIFLTDVVGLSPLSAGAVLIVGKFWDAISDPFMGYISDNTRSRFGRRRLYFLLGLLTIGLSFASLWYPIKSDNNTFLFTYYMFAYIFFSSVFTMVMVPYSALNADMTFDYKERTRLSGAKMICSQLSVLICGIMPQIIINMFPDTSTGHLYMGIIFGIFFTIPWLFVFLGTWELEDSRDRDSMNLRQFMVSFTTVFKNKSFKIHILMYLFAYSAMDIMMALFAYYLNYYIQRPDLFSFSLGIMVLGQITSLPLYIYLLNRIGSGKTYILGVSIWGIAMFGLLGLSGSSPTPLIFLNCLLIGSGLSAGVMIPWATLPFIVDIDEIITGEKRAGVYSGMMTLIRKTVQAGVLFLVGVALSSIGYIANIEQTAETLAKLKYLFILSPLIFMVLGIVCAAMFKVTPYTHTILMRELDRLRKGGKRNKATSRAIKVCEEVTGIAYPELYQ